MAASAALSCRKVSFDLMKTQDPRRPALFIGHGNPMNDVRDNSFTLQFEYEGIEHGSVSMRCLSLC